MWKRTHKDRHFLFAFHSFTRTAVRLTAIGGVVLVCSISAVVTGASTSRSTYVSLKNVQTAVEAAQHITSPPKNVTPSLSSLAANTDVGYPLQTGSDCPSLGTNDSKTNLANCTYGDRNSKTLVALVGDSRAAMWLPDFAQIGQTEHFKVVFIAKPGCPSPTANYELNNNGAVSNASWPACTAFHSFMASSLDSLKPSVIVVSTNYELDLAQPAHLASASEVQRDMTTFLNTLPKSSKRVVLGGFPQPSPIANPTDCLAKGPAEIDSCNFVPSSTVNAENNAGEAAASATGAAFINQRPWFCASTCPPIIASKIVYTVDAFHADQTYLKYLAGALWSALQPYVQ